MAVGVLMHLGGYRLKFRTLIIGIFVLNMVLSLEAFFDMTNSYNDDYSAYLQ